MGRGLSDLQRWMLEELEKEGYLPYFMIQERYFGWTADDRRPDWHSYRHFRGTVARDEYNRVNATISRSARRLAQRGLAKVNNGCLLPLQPSPTRVAELEACEASIRKAIG